VRIIGQLEHPNITPVHDVGIDEEGRHYFVMKYVDGETLESIIARLKEGVPDYVERFGIDERIDLFLCVLNAIRYAHARGIIHRDLKPANIMVGRYGEVTVVDWGIAQQRTRADVTVGPIGTPLYMSPEQASGDPSAVGERSDIYSATLLLYELLTLKHPLAELASVDAILERLRESGLDTRLNTIKLALTHVGSPTDYAALISRGLDREPARRFASIDEMEQVLKDVRDGKVPVSCHITFAKRATAELSHFIDRRPVAFTLLLATSLAGFAATAIFAATHL
jgi:serine/threonine-protein kinase